MEEPVKRNIEIKIGLPELVLIVFLVLKLCNVIDWSWWIVLSPAIVVFILGGIYGWYYCKKKRKERILRALNLDPDKVKIKSIKISKKHKNE